MTSMRALMTHGPDEPCPWVKPGGLDSCPGHVLSPEDFAGLIKLARLGESLLDKRALDLGADLDGGELQDMALKAGVLVPHDVTEPCGEGCGCADVGDFPLQCFFVAADVKAVMARKLSF